MGLQEFIGLEGHGLRVIAMESPLGGVCCLSLSGRFTYSANDEFSAVLGMLETLKAERFVLDLSDLLLLDSAGLWMLLVARNEALQQRIAFEVRGAHGTVERLLRLSAPDLLGEAALGAPDPAALIAANAEVSLVLAESWVQMGFGLGPDASELGCDALPVLVGQARAGRLAAGLTFPYFGFLEVGENGLEGVGRRVFENLRQGGIALSLFTSTVYGSDVVNLLCHALRSRFPEMLSEPALEMMELCLTEALSNAVIHGNLGVGSAMRATSAGFRQFHKIMAERLANPALACRRIEINFCSCESGGYAITVSDQGAGFDITGYLGKSVNPGAKHGRGIPLIGKVVKRIGVEDGGRTVVMEFGTNGRDGRAPSFERN